MSDGIEARSGFRGRGGEVESDDRIRFLTGEINYDYYRESMISDPTPIIGLINGYYRVVSPLTCLRM